VKRQAPPPEAAAFLQWLETDLRSPDTIAELTAEREQWERQEHERLRPFFAYLRELEKAGVDTAHLMGLITGGLPEQPVRLFIVMRGLSFLRFMRGPWQAYRRRLRVLWRRYHNTLFLLEDDALRPATRQALREDLDTVFRCLRWEASVGAWKRTVPSESITVDPTTDVSRQGFWTPPTVALVDYLRPILGTHEEAYRVTARLFHLQFDFPDNPLLIKRRYRHAAVKPDRTPSE
jgi:hypothetical protein